MAELCLAEPAVESSSSKEGEYTPYSANNYNLATPINRLVANVAEYPSGEIDFHPTALEYSRKDIDSRLLEGSAETHPFFYDLTYDPERSGLVADGDLIRDVTSRWLESDDIKQKSTPIEVEHAKAEWREAIMLDNLAREAHDSSILPNVKLLTIWTAPDDNNEQTLQLRLFNFYQEGPPSNPQVKIGVEGLVVDDMQTVDIGRIISQSGAIIPQQASSAEIANTVISVADDKYEGIFDVVEEYSSLDWQRTEEMAKPHQEAELKFTKELATNIYQQELSPAIASFIEKLLDNQSLEIETREHLTALIRNEVSLSEDVVEFLVAQHSIHTMAALGIALKNEKVIRALADNNPDRLNYITSLDLKDVSNIRRTIFSNDFINLVDTADISECFGVCRLKIKHPKIITTNASSGSQVFLQMDPEMQIPLTSEGVQQPLIKTIASTLGKSALRQFRPSLKLEAQYLPQAKEEKLPTYQTMEQSRSSWTSILGRLSIQQRSIDIQPANRLSARESASATELELMPQRQYQLASKPATMPEVVYAPETITLPKAARAYALGQIILKELAYQYQPQLMPQLVSIPKTTTAHSRSAIAESLQVASTRALSPGLLEKQHSATRPLSISHVIASNPRAEAIDGASYRQAATASFVELEKSPPNYSYGLQEKIITPSAIPETLLNSSAHLISVAAKELIAIISYGSRLLPSGQLLIDRSWHGAMFGAINTTNGTTQDPRTAWIHLLSQILLERFGINIYQTAREEIHLAATSAKKSIAATASYLPSHLSPLVNINHRPLAI
ncbi:MAG: hypothetical protein WD061_02465 [Candidatus Saccharimonadales bacterium]